MCLTTMLERLWPLVPGALIRGKTSAQLDDMSTERVRLSLIKRLLKIYLLRRSILGRGER